MDRSGKIAFCLVAACLGMGAAVAGDARKEPRQDHTTRYRLSLTGCPLSFSGRPGGIEDLQLGDGSSGYFVQAPGSAAQVSLSFRCIPGAARDVCPQIVTGRRDEDDATWKAMSVRQHHGVHPIYFASVRVESLTAVRRPAGRLLTYCLGDDSRSVAGDANVGVEGREETLQVLKVLRTIAFE